MCYWWKIRFLKFLNKSFIKISKRRGSKIDVCGTPVLILQKELKDKDPLLSISKIFAKIEVFWTMNVDYCQPF